MNAEALISERLNLALSSLDLETSYRSLLLSVGQGYLKAQVQHYKACLPPIQIPFLCCKANSGDPKRAVGVATAWFLLQVAAHLLDKVEDHELEMVGQHLRQQGVSTNLSTGLIFVAEWVLNHLELDCVDAGAAWCGVGEYLGRFGRASLLSAHEPDLSTEQCGAIYCVDHGFACP